MISGHQAGQPRAQQLAVRRARFHRRLGLEGGEDLVHVGADDLHRGAAFADPDHLGGGRSAALAAFGDHFPKVVHQHFRAGAEIEQRAHQRRGFRGQFAQPHERFREAGFRPFERFKKNLLPRQAETPLRGLGIQHQPHDLLDHAFDAHRLVGNAHRLPELLPRQAGEQDTSHRKRNPDRDHTPINLVLRPSAHRIRFQQNNRRPAARVIGAFHLMQAKGRSIWQ